MATAPIKHVAQLHQTILAGGVAIVSLNSNAIVSPANLQPQADPIIAAFDDSDAAQASRDNISARSVADSLIDSSKGAELKLLRGAAAVLVDEINLVREWTVSMKAATAAATSFANLQTRIAALPTLNDRTLQQAVTAIKAKIDAGTVD